MNDFVEILHGNKYMYVVRGFYEQSTMKYRVIVRH